MLDRDELLRRYALADRGTPHVRVNFVASLDGSATIEGRSGGLGNADDQRLLGVLRELGDVVLVGAGTVRAEGYGGVHVPLALVSSSLDLPASHPFFADAPSPRFVITHAAAPAALRAELSKVAEVIVCGERTVDLRLAIAALAERGMPKVLCEGGPRLFGDLIANDLVDEFCLSLSAMLVGGEGRRIAEGTDGVHQRMRLAASIPTEQMLFLRYVRRGPDG
ncbi:pyrimidine reductase family protein [Rathayibacter sp. YIM 133350]|uniref:pyrimidine reductase family protein n=1 Tax=Rathayibacter sp. YIM 133350 TaxID=3131992 RepID=UPI00307F37EE